MVYAVNAPNNYAKEYHCGVTVKPGDVKSIKEGIEKLLEMSQEDRKKMGQNGRRAVLENYEYSVLAKKFLETLR